MQPTGKPAVIEPAQWFRRLTGHHEHELHDSPELKRSIFSFERRADGLYDATVHNREEGTSYTAGCFRVESIGDLKREAGAELLSGDDDPSGALPITIVTRTDEVSTPAVNVADMQLNPAYNGAMFVVASNFNAVESPNENKPPDYREFVTEYFMDRTQGPTASVSAGPGAIVRVHAPFYAPGTEPEEWGQTAAHQIDLLAHPPLARIAPTRNGYVVLNPADPPRLGDANEQDCLLDHVLVATHVDTEVTYGSSDMWGTEISVAPDRTQRVSQVRAAALNMRQGASGRRNAATEGAEALCDFLLRAAYEGAYLSALRCGCDTLVLTLIGGGVFGVPHEKIMKAIDSAHNRYAPANGSIRRVVLPLFPPCVDVGRYTAPLRVPHKEHRYTANRRVGALCGQ